MSWEFETDPAYQERLDWAAEFVRAEIWPLEAIAEELTLPQRGAIQAQLRRRVKAEGLWAPHLPPELGGSGLGQVSLGLLHEILGTSPLAPEVFGCGAPDSGNAEILALAGDPDQRARYLQPLLDGTLRSAFAMTEPDTAGSDPTLLACRASSSASGWRLDGRKWYATNASVADFLIVVAVTDPAAPPRERASLFLVDAGTPGVTVLRDIADMEHPQVSFGQPGNHAEVLLDGVEVPAEAMLGAPGAGFRIAQQRLGPGRIHHCMRWLGAARRAFEMLCERALSRHAHGGPLAEKGAVQEWIAESVAEMQAARLMTLHAAWVIDQRGAENARREIATIKFYGARILHDVIDRAIQVHGALGYSADLPLEAMYRYARAARIYDGPDEVHRRTVARDVLRGRTAAPGGIPSEHLPTRRQRAREHFAPLLGEL